MYILWKKLFSSNVHYKSSDVLKMYHWLPSCMKFIILDLFPQINSHPRVDLHLKIRPLLTAILSHKIPTRKVKYFRDHAFIRGAVLVVWDTDVLVEPVFLLVVVVLVIVLGVFAVRVWSSVRVRVAGCGDPQVVLPGTCLRLAQRASVILHSKAQLYHVYILCAN